MSTTLLVDASMVYAANKAKLGHLTRQSDGYPTGAVFGLVRQIEAAIRDTGATRAVLCLDAGGTARRRSTFPEYKSGRDDTATDQQHENHGADIQEWALLRGASLAWCDGFEADDVIADIHTAERGLGRNVAILSRDHDFKQLLDDGTRIVWGKETYGAADFEDEWGFNPGLYSLYLILAGDPTDSIPPLISPAKAKRLCQELHGQGITDWVTTDPTGLSLTQMTGELDITEVTRNIDMIAMSCRGQEVTILSQEPDRVMLGRAYERLEFNSLLKTLDRLPDLEPVA